MALIPGFEYDLFISYAHADNQAVGHQPGWTSRFRESLKHSLGIRLGQADELRVFMDEIEIGANAQLSDLLDAARNSALFLAVGSPSYVERKWCKDEVDAFIQAGGESPWMFVIETLPLNAGQSYPAPLQTSIPAPFWKKIPPRNHPMTLRPDVDVEDDFRILVEVLTADMTGELLRLKNLPSTRRTHRSTSAAPAPAAPIHQPVVAATTGLEKKAVLLAQTEGSEEDWERIQSYLKGYSQEVTLLPEGCYPQGGKEFREAFEADLKRSDIFVQLLGRRQGRIPPDLPEGYLRFQVDAAKRAGVEIMQWRSPDLDLNTISDSEYKKLLTAETVAASGFEAFKEQVLTEARKRPPVVVPARGRSRHSVFINADQRDMTVARQIAAECAKHQISAYWPQTLESVSAKEKREYLEEYLLGSDVLLFIYGNSPVTWIQNQLFNFDMKISPKRDQDPDILAICSGPPAGKPEIGAILPNAVMVDCAEQWDMQKIADLLKGLVA